MSDLSDIALADTVNLTFAFVMATLIRKELLTEAEALEALQAAHDALMAVGEGNAQELTRRRISDGVLPIWYGQVAEARAHAERTVRAALELTEPEPEPEP
jgi:hypothetical protein